MRHLVDVFEENDEIAIYVHLPGILQNSVAIDVGQVGLDYLMFIFGKNLEGKEIVIQAMLPRGIDLKSGSWLWKNGILEIRFTKVRSYGRV